MDVELLGQEKPETVRNFLLYVRSGGYSTNLFLHRCVPGFVVQGGGYSVTNPASADRFSTYLQTTNLGRLTNEFLVGTRLSNTFGTLAMAKIGNDPNSATCEWFFNLADNSANLDSQNGGFTVFGRVLGTTNATDGTNVLSHFNTLSTNGGIVDLGKLLGSSYQVFTSLPVTYTNTVSRVPLNRELYYSRISILNDTYQPGQAAPSLTLISPPPNSLFTNQAVVLRGTASDDVEVARVVYRLQDAPLEIAHGTTNWEVSLSPVPGFSTVTVESIDWDGNHSAGVSVPFYYARTMPLELQINGQGTVTGLANGQTLNAGSFYTGTAVPAKSYIFDTWSGSVTSTSPTLTFQVPSDATNFNLTANFIPEPLPQLAGTYHGLFMSLGRPSLDGAGFLSMSLQGDGGFDGSILYHGGTYYYTGRFDSSGNASVYGLLDGISRTVSFYLHKTNNSGLITGTFSGTASTTPVQLERLATAVGTSNSPPAGRYTFGIASAATTPSAVIPGGNGYGEATLASAGTLGLSGVLGDTTPFTATPKLTRLGHWPLYVTLAKGKGALLGWVSYPTNQPGNLEGSLQWIQSADASKEMYPGGFSNQVAFAASPYITPPAGTRVVNWVHGLTRLESTDLGPALTNVVKLTTNNTFEVLPPDQGLLSLNVNLASGTVGGSFVHPWFGTTNSLRGTVIQGNSTIRGQFVTGNQAGSLNVDVTPFMVTQTVATVTLPALTAAMKEGGWIRFDADGTLVLAEPLPCPYSTVLDANSHSVVISGGGRSRLLTVQTNLSFSALGITFADGFFSGANGTNGASPGNGRDAMGAGILSLGGVVGLTNCLLTNCVLAGGSAAGSDTNGFGGRALGAAVCNRGGKLTLQGCTVADCIAVGGRMGATNQAARVSEQAAVAMGAGVFSDSGECRIADTLFLRNRAQGGEPILLPSGSYSYAGDAAGGAAAVAGGTLRWTNTKCLTNAAAGPSTTAGTGGSGNSFGGALYFETNVIAIVEQAVFSGNSAEAGRFGETGNAAGGRGGAIFNAGSLTLRNSTLELNAAVGGMSRPAGQAHGGGLASIGALVVESSTFSANVAQGGEYGGAMGSASGAQGVGGGIYAAAGTVAITNATFTQNRAVGGSGSFFQGAYAARGDGRGGALACLSNSVSLVHVTLAYNEAAAGPVGSAEPGSAEGGALANLNATVWLRSSILSSNTPANLFGGVTEGGYNFSSDASFSFTDPGSQTNAEAYLQPLADNGGPTRTMAITAESPARDAVRGAFPPVDQRGITRPQGTYADAGAFEFVQTLPIFSLQPSGTNVVRYGTNFTFRATATGPVPIGYYWLKDEFPLTAATNSNLTITNAQTADSGRYAAVATNSYGSVTSTVATLMVDARPLILVQPSDLILSPGASTSLVVTATGPALSYAWLHNDAFIPGAESATLPMVGTPATQGTYRAIVTNYAGMVTSRLATVSFGPSALTILTPPRNITVAEGSPSSLSVLASGIAPISYQWRKENVPLPGETNSVLSFAGTGRTNAGTYSVAVTNEYLSLTSASASLVVVAPPRLTITDQQTNIVVACFGEPGFVHRLLSATNLAGAITWTAVATNTMPETGKVTWALPVPTNGTPVYFRAVTP